MSLLNKKVALVTGAGRGLGREYTLALAASGARVVVVDLPGDLGDGASAQSVTNEIINAGGDALTCTGSVATWPECRRIVDAALAHYGRIDVLVNNAGVALGGTIDAVTESEWQHVLGVSVEGTAAMSHWVSAHWREQGPEPGRALINITSPAGVNPVIGATAYCTAKGAIAAFTIAVAEDLAELGVRVNAVAPMGRSPMTEASPFKDIMRESIGAPFDQHAPEHVAPLIVYLASSLCAHTGHVWGAEGDDILLLQGWSAEWHAENDNRQWTPETIHEALASFPLQTRHWELYPEGRRQRLQPSSEVLQQSGHGSDS